MENNKVKNQVVETTPLPNPNEERAYIPQPTYRPVNRPIGHRDKFEGLEGEALVKAKVNSMLGSPQMLAIAILLTCFISFDFLFGLIATTNIWANILLQSAVWMFILLFRFLPHILACVCVWLFVSNGRKNKQPSILSIKMFKIVCIAQLCIGAAELLGICILALVKWIRFAFNPSYGSYVMPNYSDTVLFIMFLMLVVITVFFVIFYCVLIRYVSQIQKVSETGTLPVKNSILTALLLLIGGSMLILNLSIMMNVTDELARVYGIMGDPIYNCYSLVYLNPLNILCMGAIMIIGGISVLVFHNKMKTKEK